MSSKTARATQRNPVLKNKKQKQKGVKVYALTYTLNINMV
jgi:cephalosporin-C deacetylase-like acetyl esterase